MSSFPTDSELASPDLSTSLTIRAPMSMAFGEGNPPISPILRARHELLRNNGGMRTSTPNPATYNARINDFEAEIQGIRQALAEEQRMAEEEQRRIEQVANRRGRRPGTPYARRIPIQQGNRRRNLPPIVERRVRFGPVYENDVYERGPHQPIFPLPSPPVRGILRNSLANNPPPMLPPPVPLPHSMPLIPPAPLPPQFDPTVPPPPIPLLPPPPVPPFMVPNGQRIHQTPPPPYEHALGANQPLHLHNPNATGANREQLGANILQPPTHRPGPMFRPPSIVPSFPPQQLPQPPPELHEYLARIFGGNFAGIMIIPVGMAPGHGFPPGDGFRVAQNGLDQGQFRQGGQSNQRAHRQQRSGDGGNRFGGGGQ